MVIHVDPFTEVSPSVQARPTAPSKSESTREIPIEIYVGEPTLEEN